MTLRTQLAIGAAAAGAILLAGSAAEAATNLVKNGSFETSPITSDWTLSGTGYGGGGDVPTYAATIIGYNNNDPYPTGAFNELVTPDDSISSSPDAVGGHAAYFVADNSIETLTQLVHMTPGTYKLGFSVYLPQNGVNNPVDATFKGSIAGETLANFSAKSGALGAKDWKAFSGYKTIAAEGDYQVQFSYDSRPPANYGGSLYAADVVVDRVYAVAVPEPATWALMIAGFGGAGVMLRRRRAVLAA